MKDTLLEFLANIMKQLTNGFLFGIGFTWGMFWFLSKCTDVF